LEKELEDTGMKLTSVLSDATAVTGRAILDALISSAAASGHGADRLV
jgi:hypothetical protein